MSTPAWWLSGPRRWERSWPNESAGRFRQKQAGEPPTTTTAAAAAVVDGWWRRHHVVHPSFYNRKRGTPNKIPKAPPRRSDLFPQVRTDRNCAGLVWGTRRTAANGRTPLSRRWRRHLRLGSGWSEGEQYAVAAEAFQRRWTTRKDMVGWPCSSPW